MVLESDESDPIEIISRDCKPCKLTLFAVTHNSIILQWDIPEYNENTTNSYIASYCTVTEFGKWKEEYTEGTSCKATIGNLKPNNQYLFKVLPRSESISTNYIESDISDPIMT